MPISHKYQCIFVHIPKTAGTSVEAALGMHGDKKFIGKQKYLKQEIDLEHLYGAGLQHLTLLEIKKKVSKEVFNNYHKFAIVRNPWDRLVSHFSWKDGKWAEGKAIDTIGFQQEIQNLYDHYQTKKKAFFSMKRIKTLLKYNAWEPPFWSDRHLMPQYLYVKNFQQNIGLDYLGKFESLESVWKEVSTHFGIDGLHLEKRMSSNHRNYRMYYNEATRKMVEEMYATDIKVFEYNF